MEATITGLEYIYIAGNYYNLKNYLSYLYLKFV